MLTNNEGYSINNLDYLIMPYNAMGSIPVFEAIKRNIPIYAVKENSTVLDITPQKLNINCHIVEKYCDISV